jgi:hypothetical protein
MENFIPHSRSRSEQPLIHLIKRYVLEPKDPFSIMVSDHDAIHIANPRLKTDRSANIKREAKDIGTLIYLYFKNPERMRS